MSRQLQELEALLRQLIDEHRTLLEILDRQHLAMRAGRADQIEHAIRQQETARRRIFAIESRRRILINQIARAMRLPGEPTLARLAELFPQRAAELTRLRDELRGTIEDVSRRTRLATRLAGAVLGHLNSAVRLIAGAVEQAGIYTKTGSPQLTKRIGVMEAVG